MQVRDELVLGLGLEVKAGELEAVSAQVQTLMFGAAKLRMPQLMDVGIGNGWEKAH